MSSDDSKRYRVTFSVFDYEIADSAEEAEAYAINVMANEYGIYFTEVAVIQVTELVKPEPVGLDMDEYYRMMALEGREDR
jgi:hypothetical protein